MGNVSVWLLDGGHPGIPCLEDPIAGCPVRWTDSVRPTTRTQTHTRAGSLSWPFLTRMEDRPFCSLAPPLLRGNDPPGRNTLDNGAGPAASFWMTAYLTHWQYSQMSWPDFERASDGFSSIYWITKRGQSVIAGRGSLCCRRREGKCNFLTNLHEDGTPPPKKKTQKMSIMPFRMQRGKKNL